MRSVASHASWIAPLLAVPALLQAMGTDNVSWFVQMGSLVVLLCSVGLIAGTVGIVLSIRPLRPTVLIPLAGVAISATLLFYFLPGFLSIV